MVRTGSISVLAEAIEAVKAQSRGAQWFACLGHLRWRMLFSALTVRIATVLEHVSLIGLGAACMFFARTVLCACGRCHQANNHN